MGNTIWVDVQGRREDELPRDNSIMLRLKAELDRLSDELSVPKLSQFYDDSELRAAYGDLIEQPDEGANAAKAIRAPKAGWFDPAPALSAVRKIQEYLGRHDEELAFAEDRRRRHWRATLLNELKDCQSTLEVALSRGRQFRFLIVP